MTYDVLILTSFSAIDHPGKLCWNILKISQNKSLRCCRRFLIKVYDFISNFLPEFSHEIMLFCLNSDCQYIGYKSGKQMLERRSLHSERIEIEHITAYVRYK